MNVIFKFFILHYIHLSTHPSNASYSFPIQVQWENGRRGTYRFGNYGFFDLKLWQIYFIILLKLQLINYSAFQNTHVFLLQYFGGFFKWPCSDPFSPEVTRYHLKKAALYSSVETEACTKEGMYESNITMSYKSGFVRDQIYNY